MLVPLSTPPSLPPPPQTPLPFSSLLHTLDAQWVSTSVTTASMPSSSTTISPSRPLPTVRCLSFSVVPLVVRPTLVTSSTCTPVSSSVQPRCPTSSAAVHSLHSL